MTVSQFISCLSGAMNGEHPDIETGDYPTRHNPNERSRSTPKGF
jgi:hypothetical protein